MLSSAVRRDAATIRRSARCSSLRARRSARSLREYRSCSASCSRLRVRSRTTISVLMTDISVVCIVCGTRSRGSCSPRDRLWLRGPVLRGHFGLARTPTWALPRHDRAADQQLATPDTPGLPALERTGQAGQPGLTAPAHRLGGLHVLGRLGEEQLRVLRARKIQAHRERGGRTSHPHDAGLIEYLPDVWLLPCRH